MDLIYALAVAGVPILLFALITLVVYAPAPRAPRATPG